MTLRTLADTKNKLENIERMGSFNFSLVECIQSDSFGENGECVILHKSYKNASRSNRYNIRTVNFLFLKFKLHRFSAYIILMSYNSAQHANVTRSDTLVSNPTHLQVEAFKSGASN